MPKAWMVRSEGGEVADDFAQGFVALGWKQLGDLSCKSKRETIRELYDLAYPEHNPGKASGAVAMLDKFRSVIRPGDKVVTYDPRNREYLEPVTELHVEIIEADQSTANCHEGLVDVRPPFVANSEPAELV